LNSSVFSPAELQIIENIFHPISNTSEIESSSDSNSSIIHEKKKKKKRSQIRRRHFRCFDFPLTPYYLISFTICSNGLILINSLPDYSFAQGTLDHIHNTIISKFPFLNLIPRNRHIASFLSFFYLDFASFAYQHYDCYLNLFPKYNMFRIRNDTEVNAYFDVCFLFKSFSFTLRFHKHAAISLTTHQNLILPFSEDSPSKELQIDTILELESILSKELIYFNDFILRPLSFSSNQHVCHIGHCQSIQQA